MHTFAFFEWVVVDNCNLKCSYCVNKTEYSHKSKEAMLYRPGNEVSVARRIVDISKEVEYIVVNLTGGEPTLAPRLEEAIRMLAAAGNIEIRLITNLRLVDRFKAIAPYLSQVLVSIHVSLRSREEIDAIIATVQEFKGKLQITLSQVDLELTADNRAELDRISRETGLSIIFQPFIVPWTEANAGHEIKKNTGAYSSSFGKRCALGYFYFLIESDGTLKYDLWCITRKHSHSVSMVDEGFRGITAYILKDMKTCPNKSCGCNYNYFFHDLYLRECQSKTYARQELFAESDDPRQYWAKSRLKSRWRSRLAKLIRRVRPS